MKNFLAVIEGYGINPTSFEGDEIYYYVRGTLDGKRIDNFETNNRENLIRMLQDIIRQSPETVVRGRSLLSKSSDGISDILREISGIKTIPPQAAVQQWVS